MGADEKHAATYHGAEYDFGSPEVVTAKRVRFMSDSDFNRWLETVRAEAKAEALREAASAYPVMLRDMVSRGSVEAWLRARANQHKEEPANGR